MPASASAAKGWPQRTWAVEGANGTGRPLAQRLLHAGERVLDVPAKLAARIRLFDTGHQPVVRPEDRRLLFAAQRQGQQRLEARTARAVAQGWHGKRSTQAQ